MRIRVRPVFTTQDSKLTRREPNTGGGGNYFFITLPLRHQIFRRQIVKYYGSFTRDLCDKYLTAFSDFKVARSFFNASAAAATFSDPFKEPGTNVAFSPTGISVPMTNPFNPFTVANATIPNFFPDGSGLPVHTGVGFRSINDQVGEGSRPNIMTTYSTRLRGEMGWIADYFKTWNWEMGFRHLATRERPHPREWSARQGCGRRYWIPILPRRSIRS
jgi:hypothetical protein